MKINLPNLEIYYPGDIKYNKFLSGLFSTASAHCRPSAIVLPRTHQDIVDFVQYANQSKLKFSICGGGLSSLAVKDNIICLALNCYYNQVTTFYNQSDCFVQVQGGASVGKMLSTLNTLGYHIPVGVSPLPGLGLIMRGGIGHLSRSEGLTLDHIVHIKFITATSDECILTPDCDNQELWNALRGAAPRFGVVSEVILKAVPNNLVSVATFTSCNSVLSNWLKIAHQLPNYLSASFVLGFTSPDDKDAVLFGFIVNQDHTDYGVREIEELSYNLCNTQFVWQTMPQTMNYVNLPDFDIPATTNLVGQLVPLVKSYLIKNVALINVADILIQSMKTAPNKLCRIDLQHMGGKIETTNNGAVFGGRNADWNLVITAFGDGFDDKNSICWVTQTLKLLEPVIYSVYSVEIRENTPETEKELTLAFAQQLSGLKHLAHQLDPKGLISHYPL